MAQDVRQWLEEIRRLQQQLAEALRDRDAAVDSGAQWRQLYNTEAQQRRTETKLHQQTIAALESQIQQLQSFPSSIPDETEKARQQEVEQLATVEELKTKLAEALRDRDRARELIHQLTQALKDEQAHHAETRKSLTTALGDAVDLLTKAQGARAVSVEVMTDSSEDAESAVARLPASQSSLLQLPPLRPVW